ncbi:MAG: ZIP family metal transporter, partial [Oscillospiraceae bacterium]|nr:ZIP family metal transporter [Oscillospiraceae bacterium]
MTDMMKVLIGVLLPFLGTTLGAAAVFFMKGEMNPKLQKALLGFASGVMVAASVWSLIMPGIEMAEAAGQIAWLPAAAGFLCGMGFLLVLDSLIPHLHLNSDKPEGRPCGLGKSFMLVFSVALHNL